MTDQEEFIAVHIICTDLKLQWYLYCSCPFTYSFDCCMGSVTAGRLQVCRVERHTFSFKGKRLQKETKKGTIQEKKSTWLNSKLKTSLIHLKYYLLCTSLFSVHCRSVDWVDLHYLKDIFELEKNGQWFRLKCLFLMYKKP